MPKPLKARNVKSAASPGAKVPGHVPLRQLSKQEFGRRLYRCMMDAKMSQSDLARAADMGRDSISTYIRGRSMPEPKNLHKLAAALDVKVEELYPEELLLAMKDEIPAIELTQAAGQPDKAWLRVNRMVSFSTAAKIIDLLEMDDRD